jgi:hypothetical protein
MTGESSPHERLQEGRAQGRSSQKAPFKKTADRLTGSRRLRAEGRGDQAKGSIKQAGEKSKTPSRSSLTRRIPGRVSNAAPRPRHPAPPSSAGLAHRFEPPQIREQYPMFIGFGTIVLIVIIVLVVLLMRRH